MAPPPHGHQPSAVTASGLHSPRRLLGHCPQAQVPEAGVFLLCFSVGHRPEGRLWGIWKETSCSRHQDSSQRDRTGHVRPTLAGLRGLPAGRSSGVGGHQAWLVFKCPGFRFSSHSFHAAPVGQFEAHAQVGSLCTLLKRCMWHVFDSRQTLCRLLESQHGQPARGF